MAKLAGVDRHALPCSVYLFEPSKCHLTMIKTQIQHKYKYKYKWWQLCLPPSICLSQASVTSIPFYCNHQDFVFVSPLFSSHIRLFFFIICFWFYLSNSTRIVIRQCCLQYPSPRPVLLGDPISDFQRFYTTFRKILFFNYFCHKKTKRAKQKKEGQKKLKHKAQNVQISGKFRVQRRSQVKL